MELTEEQRKFVDDMEKEFSNRFTETDEVYWEEHTSPLPVPPIIEPWYNKQRRRFDYAKRGRDNDYNGRPRDRGPASHGRYDRPRDRSPRRDNRSNRDRYDDRGGNGNHSDRDNHSHRDRGDYSRSQRHHPYRR